MSKVPKLTWYPLPENQYINEPVKKDQIFIHHTASSGNPYGVIRYWAETNEAVSTAFLIGRGNGHDKTTKKDWVDGELLQCFNSRKWGWHLGLKSKHLLRRGGRSSPNLNAMGVGIEICNWGQLRLTDRGFLTYADRGPKSPSIVPEDQVYEFTTPYRGYKYYQKYTEAQLETTRDLLTYLCDTYDIDRAYKGIAMFDIDNRCLRGESGIWTHTSCRPDKNDCSPQKELLELLSSL